MTFPLFVFAALAAAPQEAVTAEAVDLIEINHFYNEQGEKVLDQLIFYDWAPHEGQMRYQVRAWRLVKSPSQLPAPAVGGGYASVFYDGYLLRKITSPHMRETWTQYDPEVAERVYLPKEKRLDLYRPMQPTRPAEGPAIAAAR